MSQAARAIGVACLSLVMASCAPPDGDEPELDDAEESEEALDEAVSDVWSDGPGFGIRFRRANESPDVAIFYGGYGATLTASQSWADETFAEDLEARGFGVLYAVKGPLHADYRDWEIGNSKIAKRLIGEEGKKASRIVVIAHSSGAFVAHELLSQLADGRDIDGATAGKITYFNLDGAGGPPSKALQNLGAAWAVSVRDANGVRSMNASTADFNASNYAAAGKGGLHELAAQAGVCASGAKWCLHMVTTNEVPHDKWGLDVAHDYTDFDGHPVQLGFLSRLAE